MAIYHLSVKPVSRSAGRTATAAAAYRSGERIVDERTGEIHDYTRKSGVESTDLILPEGAPEWAGDRSKLWNAAEAAEKRKDACVAREYEVALPVELSPAERRTLALEFAKDMANREGCAVDVAIHAPGKEGDHQNHHAHILRTTRKVEAEGLGEKLDTEKAGRHRKNDLEAVRERWAELSNAALERAGVNAKIDHRSLDAQGIDREPTKHLGPAATEFERRTGEPSALRLQHQLDALERLTRAKEIGDMERESRQLDRSVIDLSGDLKAAVADRDRGMEAIRAAAVQAEAAKVEAAKVQAAQAEAAKVEAAKAETAKVQAEKWQAMAQSFANDPVVDAVKKYPELVNAYATVAALDKQAEAAGMSAAQRAGITKRVHENVTKSIEAGVVPTAPAPVKQQEPAKPERIAEAPRQAVQAVAVDPLKTAAATVGAWREAVAVERRDHLAELTRRAEADATAEVHRHNAHLAAKPMLFGRDKWEAARQGFEARDREMRGAAADLKSGKYPSLGADVQAVQQAAEQRAGGKNPALAREAAEAAAALQAERERIERAERIAAADRREREYEERERREAGQRDHDNDNDQDYGR